MQLRRRSVALAVAAPLLWLTGCASLSTYSDFDRDADFSAYHSFAWLAPPLRETPERAADPFESNSLLDKRVRRAVEAALVQRGLQPAEAGEPDLRADYRVLYGEQLLAHETRVGPYFRRTPPFFADVDVHVSKVPEATLVVDLIDARTQHLVWRGWTTARDHDRRLDEAELLRAVTQILRRYPPAPDA